MSDALGKSTASGLRAGSSGTCCLRCRGDSVCSTGVTQVAAPWSTAPRPCCLLSRGLKPRCIDSVSTIVEKQFLSFCKSGFIKLLLLERDVLETLNLKILGYKNAGQWTILSGGKAAPYGSCLCLQYWVHISASTPFILTSFHMSCRQYQT